ncbi:sulfur carrier protein ThiS [uncultured Campylobacter sp.]|uniref:sulfur carrier protein ThiS n=1 Tax=uncultured Campylobacter sp. TaxID=218934 RepID=UPI0026024BCB|nr:sulfur carrier protein ThiS [uncultured Campylobacter sp.]
MIEICVNGESLQLAQDMSVSEFLRSRGHDLRLVALERDGEILKKEAWERTQISSGKKYEIVEFVGGG